MERWLRQAGRIGTVSGRYYAMDRDRRWERTKLAYDAIVHAEGQRASSAAEAVESAYERGETDEFIRPTVIGGYDGAADGDVVLAFNFRPDRMRQIIRALGESDFDEFPRGSAPTLDITTMTRYQEAWDYPVAFEPVEPETTLAEVIAENGGRQLHVAETEKYAHVTYFFNGGREREWEGEERALVDSPRDVPTYDHKPEMSAREAARAFCERWAADGYRFGIINFANPDMVGHTGDIPAAVRAIEAVDACLGDVLETVRESGGACIVTADHGNAEQMLEPDGSPNTAHSLNPVPLVVTLEGLDAARRRDPRRRRADGARPAGDPETGRDDGRASRRYWRRPLEKTLQVVAGEVLVQALPVSGSIASRSACPAGPRSLRQRLSPRRIAIPASTIAAAGTSHAARSKPSVSGVASTSGPYSATSASLTSSLVAPAAISSWMKARSRSACGDWDSCSVVPQIGHMTSSSMSASEVWGSAPCAGPASPGEASFSCAAAAAGHSSARAASAVSSLTAPPGRSSRRHAGRGPRRSA